MHGYSIKRKCSQLDALARVLGGAGRSWVRQGRPTLNMEPPCTCVCGDALWGGRRDPRLLTAAFQAPSSGPAALGLLSLG